MKDAKVRKWKQTDTLQWVLDSGYIDNWKLAIDGGAHVGNWSRMMAEQFDRVLAFEPAPDNAEEFRAALIDFEHADRITFYEKAIMDKPCRINVTVPPKRLSNQSRYCVASPDGAVDAVSVGLAERRGCWAAEARS
jgi:FkbM family methyltransferase